MIIGYLALAALGATTAAALATASVAGLAAK